MASDSLGASAARRAGLPLALAIGASAVCISLYFLHTARIVTFPGLERAEPATIDARFVLRGARPLLTDEIVVVALDEKTRTKAPDLFQKRAGWARLLGAIGRQRPAAIGIDGYFAAPEITLPAPVVAQVRAARDGLARESATAAVTAALQALDAVLSPRTSTRSS